MAARLRGLRDGTLSPSTARDAATVVLLREAPGGPEVYLLRRVRGMAFASGMYVFPGGSVDREDAAVDLRWAGPPPAWWAGELSCDEPLARALVCAAVRETFEESGVLLAGPSADEVLADVSTDEWEAERSALESRRCSMSDLLSRHRLVLRSDLLRPLAHWVTPEAEPKRFDTRFFLAEMPLGQVCRPVGGEADERVWTRPAEARAAGLAMLPPTAAVLAELAAFPDVASALAAPRTLRPLQPVYEMDDQGRVTLTVPDPLPPPDPP